MSYTQGTIDTYASRMDLVVEWRIAGFSTLNKRDLPYFWSPYFSFGGERWHLEILQVDPSKSDSSGHIDLLLRKCSFNRSIRQSFSVSLKTAEGKKCKEEHCTKDFDDLKNRCHTFNRFITRLELRRRRSELLPYDVLTVICTMKSWISTESNSDSASAEISTPASDSAGCSSDSGECRYCKGSFAAGSLSSHQRKCEQRPVKCPDCSEVVVLQKFLNEHECRQERPEAEKSGNIFVETFTQTGKENAKKSENICVETSTQTEKENAEKFENICVETSTQTEKEIAEKSENICVETSTQTEEEIAAKSENICVETSTQTEKEIGEGFEYIFVVTSAQTGKVNAENDPEQNSENTSVEPCTQMDEKSENSKRIYVNASTQTGEENEERDWMTDVLDFLKAGNGIDVTFEVETPNGHVEFFAHKLILAMKSPFFADEFYGEGKTDAHLVIPLKGINPKAFMEMLRYCYDNKPRMRTIEEACVLFKVASDFKIFNLQKLCHTFIKYAKLDP